MLIPWSEAYDLVSYWVMWSRTFSSEPEVAMYGLHSVSQIFQT